MRSILLASAAIFMTAGMALAQTSMTSPAPTGAPNAPVMAPPGDSPGNMGSNPPAAGSMGMATGASPGSMGSNTPSTTAGPGMKTTSSMPMSHSMGMSHGTAMPETGAPETYLHVAKMAMKHHDKMMADDALSHAETRLLDRSVPQGQIAADDSPAVTTIEHARMALGSGNMAQAASDTDMAMQQVHGMMDGMSSPMATSSMGGPNQ